MLISRKRHREVCRRYEETLKQLREEVDELQQLRWQAARYGGPYQYIMECRQAVLTLKRSGESEKYHHVLEQLAYIDRWICELASPLTQGIARRSPWLRVMQDNPADVVYAGTHLFPRSSS